MYNKKWAMYYARGMTVVGNAIVKADVFPREEAQGTSYFEASDTRSADSGDGSDSSVDREFSTQPQQEVCPVKQGVLFRLAWTVHDCVLLISA